MIEWEGIFRLSQFSGVLGHPHEVQPNFGMKFECLFIINSLSNPEFPECALNLARDPREWRCAADKLNCSCRKKMVYLFCCWKSEHCAVKEQDYKMILGWKCTLYLAEGWLDSRDSKRDLNTTPPCREEPSTTFGASSPTKILRGTTITIELIL